MCPAPASTSTVRVANLRLSYCYPEPDRIREGVRRLAEVIETELDLAETFGTSHALNSVTGSTVPSPDLQ